MLLENLKSLEEERYRGPYANENEKWHNDLKVDHEWAERTATPLAVIIIDLNNLKSINDTISHMAGDRALNKIIELLEELETGGLRIGGDEFGIALMGGAQEAEELIQELRSEYQKFLSQPENEDIKDGGAGLSIGAAVYSPQQPLSLTELLAAADEGVYDDKERQSDATDEEKELIRQLIRDLMSKGRKRRNIARLVLAELRSGRELAEIIQAEESPSDAAA